MSEEPNIVLNVASQLSYLLCCSIPSIMSEEPNIVLNVASQLSYIYCVVLFPV